MPPDPDAWRAALPLGGLSAYTEAQLAEQKEAAEQFENSPEYKPWANNKDRRSTQLAQINASMAYARGATGKGEVVALTDTGFYRDVRHDEFANKIIQGGTTTLPSGSGEHAVKVASMIAAKRGGDDKRGNMHGVAFDAKLVFQQFTTQYFPADLNTVTEEDNKRVVEGVLDLQYARDHGAAIVNFSLGIIPFARHGFIHEYHDGTRNQEILNKFQYSADYLAQKDTPDANKIIVVWAAGNDDGKSPGIFKGLGVHFPDLRKNVLTVVAVDQNGDIKTKAPNDDTDWGSNRCGIAKAFCLAAPGVDIVAASAKRITGALPTAKKANERHLTGGTSLAAPAVSGGLAVLRSHFKDGNTYQLGNTELVARLLATANKDGKYANSDIYGHGLMDLDAATKPYGNLMNALSTDPNARPFDASAFSLSGNAFGGAMRDALGGVKIAAFDELDAPFFFPLADGVSHAPQISAGHSDTLHEHELALGGAANASLALSLAAGELSAARIRRGNLWFSYGHHGGREAGLYYGDHANHLAGGNENLIGNFGMNFATENAAETSANAARHFRAPLAFASPYLSLVRDGPGLGWSQPLRSGARFGFSLMHGAPQFDHFANPGGARGLGALFDFRPNNTSLSLQAGAVREADGFLGARAQGNFGEISADTAFAGIGGDWAAMQNWRLLASAYLGHTKADTGDGMLRAADDIVSSAFSLGLARAGLARRGDWLGLRLSQPLRAESGAAHLRIPAGRTKYREVLHRQHKLELTPSGRNLQVEAEYRVPFAGGNLRAGLGFDRHANHDRARDLETFLRLGFERRF